MLIFNAGRALLKTLTGEFSNYNCNYPFDAIIIMRKDA